MSKKPPIKKNATHWGEWIRNHPKTPDLLQKLFNIAMDEKHPNHVKAINILIDRIAPSLKASELKIEGDITPGVIVLPEKSITKESQTTPKIEKIKNKPAEA
jgi:hypothetical protein|tara:strand:- start:18724 stop:19029 length:306 start_codon:yes stop_codon:yes gene_type:complete